MNTLFSCPHCSRSIHFPSNAVNHLVCTCGNVVYKEAGPAAEGRMVPVISSSQDIIQQGTEGAWNGKKFIVTGRFRIWFEEQAFNYWSIDFADGNITYLAEGYGLYSIFQLLKITSMPDSIELAALNLDRTLDIDGYKELNLLRKSQGHYWDVEGAFYKKDGKRLNSFELTTSNGDLLTIFEFGQDSAQAFATYPVSFENLQLDHLRASAYSGKEFVCTECKHVNTVNNYPYAQSWVCSNCDAWFSLVRTGQVKFEGSVRQNILPDIPLDTKIKLSGTTYTVTGLAVKEDCSHNTGIWKEYTLHDPVAGYAFLNESEGNWMLVKEQQIAPPVYNLRMNSFSYNGRSYQLYNKYTYRVISATGEFAGNIFNDKAGTYAYDFIAPPELWSGERSNSEGITWFHGVPVKRSVLQKQLNVRLPSKRSVGLLAPGIGNNMNTVIRTTLFCLFAVILIHFFLGAISKEKVLVNNDFMMADSLTAQTFVTDRFSLEKWKSNLEFEIYAPVDNSWFELGATLVNAGTGDEYSIEQGVEYYHGYTDGESWAEGAQTETAHLNSIPSGTYFLRISGIRDAGITGSRVSSFQVKVTNDVPMARNLVFTIIFLLIYPVLIGLISHNRERNRWYGSPYTTYTYTD